VPKPGPTVYEELLAVTHVYLGPAADRFINRQIENHLHKTPELITAEDLAGMVDWIRAVVSLISDDSEVIEEYVAELRKLAGGKI
jgi:hypothetical protein